MERKTFTDVSAIVFLSVKYQKVVCSLSRQTIEHTTFYLRKQRARACLKKAFRELQKTCRIHSFVSYRSILSHSSQSFPCPSWHKKAPPVGLEPTTLRLTAACSTD